MKDKVASFVKLQIADYVLGVMGLSSFTLCMAGILPFMEQASEHEGYVWTILPAIAVVSAFIFHVYAIITIVRRIHGRLFDDTL